MNQKLYPLCCWDDDGSLEAAKEKASKQKDEIEKILIRHKDVREKLSVLGALVTKHKTEWETIETAAAINEYLLYRFISCLNISNNSELLKRLDSECIKLHKLVESDWDRNRHPDDLNKGALHQGYEHLLNRFLKMHKSHEELMK